MNRQGGQPIRGMSAFGAQPNRNSSQMNAGRLPNGKMSGPQGGGWPFGAQNSAAGLPPTSRTPLSGGASFAQSLGAGAQSSSTPLDPSDFPSLSNTSSSAFPNPSSQAVWSTGRPSIQAAPGNSGSMGLFSSRAIGSQQDDAPHLGQGEDGQISGPGAGQSAARNDHMDSEGLLPSDLALATANPPAIEEFPPLGGPGSSDLGQDRRVNMMQNAANNVQSGGKPQNSEDPLRQNSSPFDAQGPSHTSAMSPDGATSNLTSDGSASSTGRDPMLDKYGLPELLKRVRSDDPNMQALAIGHDLTTLGLDLGSNEPLWPTWSGPFGTQPARPMTPEFALPACYKVNNVRPLADKIANFNTETLFIIFYQMPGDVAQEYAAYELTHRNWRFHKIHKFWFTRLNTVGVPFATQDGERGVYEIFNFPFMRRESRQMYVKWADIDDHIVPAGAFEPMIN